MRKMRAEYYRLDGHEVVPCEDVQGWAEGFEDRESRKVARTVVDGHLVSTVFLGVNHRLGDDGPPLVFETMVFKLNGDPEYEHTDWLELYCDRYSTWGEAVAGHDRAIQWVMSGMPEGS